MRIRDNRKIVAVLAAVVLVGCHTPLRYAPYEDITEAQASHLRSRIRTLRYPTDMHTVVRHLGLEYIPGLFFVTTNGFDIATHHLAWNYNLQIKSTLNTDATNAFDLLEIHEVTLLKRPTNEIDASAFAKIPLTRQQANLLSLVGPVVVVMFDFYLDGGTCLAILRDADGKTMRVSVDSRLHTKTPGRITIGAYHPSESGGTHHDPASPVAKALCTIVEDWLHQPLLKPLWPLVESYRETGIIGHTPELETWLKNEREKSTWPYDDIRSPFYEFECALRMWNLLKPDERHR